TVQCMQYAARVAELIESVGGDAVEPELVDRLSVAQSNLPDEGDGRQVWQRRVRPAKVDSSKVASHIAVHALVEPDHGRTVDVHGFRCEFLDRVERRSGRARMVAATLTVRSVLTEAATPLCFAGLYLGEQHVTGGVRPRPAPTEWAAIVEELTTALKTGDVFAAQRVIDHHFPGAQLSLGSLLPGSRERVLAAVLAEPIRHAEEELADSFDEHAPLIRWLVAHDLPVPETLQTVAEMAMRRRVLANLNADAASFQALRQHLAEAADVRVSLDTPEIALAASEGLRRLVDRLAAGSDGPAGLDPLALEVVSRAAEVAGRRKSSVDLWFAQNTTWKLLAKLPELRARGGTDPVAAQAAGDLERLARALRLSVPNR
ncbi:MAG TPA: DUF3536 domain-containing protein, partial [Kofleriaceae bacterium]|nr:DUF3536 domain-containing protein [Kofleriaceae bacterium]